MHIVEREIRKKYRYSNLSYVFDVYMECEYRANLTQEEYDGLLPGEFRFDYEGWGRRLGFSKKQLVRAIKELTINNAVIVQTFKGRKGNCSKYFLTRFEEQKKERNEELKRNGKGTEKSLENTEVESNTGTEKGIQKEQNEEQKKEHSSRYNNLDIISNNIYSHWNSKGIIKHRELNQEFRKAIEKALKTYSENEIIQAIDNYGAMFNSDYKFCDYKWGLDEFLVRTDKDGIRQLPMFLNDGSKYLNYLNWKNKKQNNESEPDDFGLF